jgi:hypothetical protein
MESMIKSYKGRPSIPSICSLVFRRFTEIYFAKIPGQFENSIIVKQQEHCTAIRMVE